MLATNQALEYHLNRKFRCNANVCATCARTFSTLGALRRHEPRCEMPTDDLDLNMARAAFEYAPVPIWILLDSKVAYRNARGRFVSLDTPANELPQPVHCFEHGYFTVAYGTH